MTAQSPTSPNLSRFSRDRDGFQPLMQSHSNTMPPNDHTIDIPLEQVPTNKSTRSLRSLRLGTGTTNVSRNEQQAFAMETPMNEKGGLFHRHGGKRRIRKLNSKGEPTGSTGYDGEEDTINRVGKFYNKILNFSIVTRYFIYVLPLALLIAIPIIVGATAAQDAAIGGVRIVWFFTWVEIVWLSIWVAKLVARALPYIFQTLVGVVSSGTRKYALVLRALEIPLSLVGWALASLATFVPLMTRNPDARRAAAQQKANNQTVDATTIKQWETVVQHLLAAALVSTLVLLGEKMIIQLISINYHRKQFNLKIKDNKHNIYLLGLFYDASRALFPAFCPEFAEEDYVIEDSLNLTSLTGGKGSGAGSGAATPMRFIQNVGRFGDQITSAFGNVASEITGKKLFNANSAHSIVTEALEKTRSSEALAKRLWMSFVVEGRESLFPEDIEEVLGRERKAEAEECFTALDRDGNGDISLDEMIMMVVEIGRERKSLNNSMHDVDQAINVLDRLLATAIFIICIFIFIAFLNASFVTTLATAGTALLSLSFVFASTAAEVLGSCIFLFVKHPYDIGDRIDLTTGTDQLIVDHISLLFTNFRRCSNGKLVQIPNIVLNSLWIENVTRSGPMKETISVFCAFDTSFEDIKLLRNELLNFVQHKDNCRDYQPDIEVEVASIAKMDSLELHVEIRHKGNWANGTLASARRSKFMCALVQALRRVPIYGPGGGDPGLGAAGNASYSVAISPEEAEKRKADAAAAKEAKRLFPTTTTSPISPAGKSTGVDWGNSTGGELRAIDQINTRAPARDPIRDEAINEQGFKERSPVRENKSSHSAGRPSLDPHSRPSLDPQDMEDTSSLIKRNSTRGKRTRAREDYSPGLNGLAGSSQSRLHVSTAYDESPLPQSQLSPFHAVSPTTQTPQRRPPPAYTSPPRTGNSR